jgi:hypothetical protein
MTGPGYELGISDSALLQIEAEALSREAQSPDISEAESESLLQRASRARAKILFIEVRAGLSMTRPGLDLPYPQSDETFQDYYDRMKALADKFDEEERN